MSYHPSEGDSREEGSRHLVICIKFYGIDRLCDVVSMNWARSAEQIKQAAIEDLRVFIGEQKVFDDITLVVLKLED